jgi:hypothetical protein
MAYNKKNKYNRIIEIQTITMKYKEQGVTQEFIYNNYIKPKFYISRDCFYEYLGTNAKGELKKLEEELNKKAAEKARQKSLF